jgi:hypothetical protein
MTRLKARSPTTILRSQEFCKLEALIDTNSQRLSVASFQIPNTNRFCGGPELFISADFNTATEIKALLLVSTISSTRPNRCVTLYI